MASEETHYHLFHLMRDQSRIYTKEELTLTMEWRLLFIICQSIIETENTQEMTVILLAHN